MTFARWSVPSRTRRRRSANGNWGAVFLDHKDVEQVAGSARVGDQCKMAFCERIAVHDDAADVVGIFGSGKKLFIEIVESIFLVFQHQNGLCLR